MTTAIPVEVRKPFEGTEVVVLRREEAANARRRLVAVVESVVLRYLVDGEWIESDVMHGWTLYQVDGVCRVQVEAELDFGDFEDAMKDAGIAVDFWTPVGAMAE